MGMYYDIDDILLEEEPISVIFQIGANGVGLLDPSSETNNIEKSAKVDLPFWLAHELYLRQAVSINVPHCFSQKTRKEIQADAACVDLRFRSPYFYELGCKLLPLVTDKSIGPFLQYAFSSRYTEILCKSHSITGATPKFSSKLTKEESQCSSSKQIYHVNTLKGRVESLLLQKVELLPQFVIEGKFKMDPSDPSDNRFKLDPSYYRRGSMIFFSQTAAPRFLPRSCTKQTINFPAAYLEQLME